MRIQKIRGEILTKRPEGMDYETYRVARKEQEKQIARRLRFGFMVWPSKGWGGQKDHEGKFIPVQNRGTLVGRRVPGLQFID